MYKVCSIFSQVLKLFSRGDFEKAVKEHKAERHARGFTSWGQFMAMLFCQLGRAHSLREICGGLACCEGQLKHLGVPVAPKKSTLAYANENRPWELYQTVFEQTLFKCQDLVSSQGGRKKFRFKNKLMSLDGSIIDLSVSMFDWAKYKRTKGAIKLHLLLDHDGYLPSFAVVTEGKTSEIKVARTLRFAPGHDPGHRPRLRGLRVVSGTDAGGSVLRDADERERGLRGEGRIAGSAKQQRGAATRSSAFPDWREEGEEPVLFRRVEIWDEEKQEIHGVPHRTCWPSAATTIAAIYKDRWQVELFFKALKQTLKIKTFVGTSANAVQDPGVDGADRDAGAEVPAVEIEVLLVIVDAGGIAAATIVLLSGSVGLAGRSVSGPAGARPACTTTRNSLQSRGRGSWTAENPSNEATLISGGK